MQKIIGLDSETWPIGPNSPYPDVVCFSAALEEGSDFRTHLVGNHPSEHQETELKKYLESDAILVFHNASYDLVCFCGTFPDLIPTIFDKLDRGEVRDTFIREALLDLHDHGSIKEKHMPNGGLRRLDYSLGGLMLEHFGIDLSEEKHAEDAWRLNYHLLEGVHSKEYPDEAREYAVNDPIYTMHLYSLQEKRARDLERETKIDPFVVEPFRVYADFALSLMTLVGSEVDPEQVKLVQAMLDEELDPSKMQKMLEHKILIPGRPPAPYKNGAKDHVLQCPGHKDNPSHRGTVKECGCPVKMKAAVKEKISMKTLKEHIEKLAERIPDVRVWYTEPTEKFPEGQIATNNAWMDEFAELDDTGVLQEYKHRESLQKLVTSYMNKLVDDDGNVVETIHPCFDVLKETGRTSSYGSKKYPSWNCQQADPRIRPTIKAREGFWLLSTDYNSLELITLAQRCLDSFGHSMLADVINSGGDPHAYLGARIAFELDPTFQEIARHHGDTTQKGLYEAFLYTKMVDEFSDVIYKKYRKFAKPTGLGYPGGLGPRTFISYAKSPYGVEVDLETAKLLREFWFETYPEMREHLSDVNDNCQDFRNSPRTIKNKKGEPENVNLYKYTTPFGMLRSGCFYTACANGIALQSPAAEGALTAVCQIVRECYADKKSVLFDRCIPTMFIHDELVMEVPTHEHGPTQDCIDRIEQLMINGMSIITPDVKVGVESALMINWSKSAEPTYNEKGELIPWEYSKES